MYLCAKQSFHWYTRSKWLSKEQMIKMIKFRSPYGVTGKGILLIFKDVHWSMKVDIWKFMFFKSRSGSSRLVKTVIFEVVPRGPGDPLVRPANPGKARAERWRKPRARRGIKRVNKQERRARVIYHALGRRPGEYIYIYIYIYTHIYIMHKLPFHTTPPSLYYI